MNTKIEIHDFKDFDFVIDQYGSFIKVKDIDDDNITFESWAKNYINENNLREEIDNIKHLYNIKFDNMIDYLINYYGFVSYEHIGENVIIKQPEYSWFCVKMSKEQKKNLVDFVLNYEQKGSALSMLTDILEIDSDEETKIMQKVRR